MLFFPASLGRGVGGQSYSNFCCTLLKPKDGDSYVLGDIGPFALTSRHKVDPKVNLEEEIASLEFIIQALDLCEGILFGGLPSKCYDPIVWLRL